MYEKFYHFTGMPFQLTPDSRFFYGSKGHTRAISHLIYGLSQGEGFVIVTGEVGAGKTTLVERLWAELDRDTYTLARINTTQVSGDDLFRLTMSAFGIDIADADRATLLRAFSMLLAEHRATGRHCLLVVDEAQNLSLAALEELRMLSNMTEGGRASLQTILLGQPQFRRKLASPDLDQLRQRVLASYHLGPLAADETRAYIEHRLTAVGAFAAVFRHTGGIPRRINRLCSRVLLYAALEEADTIGAPMVDSTAEELHHDIEGGADEAAAAHAIAAPSNGQAYGELLGRVQALEQAMARRERVFQRLMDVFGGYTLPRG
jgi:type II secretory pathway predicted ATPase ExeA